MQEGDLLVQVLRQCVDLKAILPLLGPELHLRERLVGERRRHDEGGMPHRIAEIDQPAFRQKDDALAIGNSISSTCGLTLFHLKLRSDATWISESKWPILQTMARSFIARMCSRRMTSILPVQVTKNVGPRRGLFHGRDLVAFHRRLQGADRIDFGDDDTAAGVPQRGGRTLADIAKARDHRDLAEAIMTSVPRRMPVDERFTAAVQIVELRLGDWNR